MHWAARTLRTRTECSEEKFEEHHLKDKLLPGTIDRKDMLILYGLYKQAKIGNVNTDRPVLSNGMDIAMWDAWKAFEVFQNAHI
ncbi:unnamed protein product [Cuscuta campestris]|uniref:ACB domain-containing protein n=1 Tax=Cuscuta campestris TaxID=132261 RepID=A0A484L3D3_9ASTE|nr:unnamed protein product [Cuscuta campestris]